MPTLSINGTELYYLQDGAGEDVVLLHGLASNLAFWYSGVMVPLRRHYRVTAYDLRGHGKSGMPAKGYTHFSMAEDLGAVANALHLERFHLIGHSYGGLVAITYALAHPDRLLSLTLADVPVDDPLDAGHQGGKESMNRYPELELLEQLARMPVKNGARPASYVPFRQGKGSGRTAKLWLKLLETTSARHDFQTRRISLQELQELKVPTLLTYGFNSGWKKSGELLQEHLPDTNLLYIHGAGHAHPWEKPGFFLQSWLDFVHTLDLRPSPDRRQQMRNSLCLLLELHDEDGKSCAAKTVDVSMSGLLIDSPEDFRAGTTVRLFAKNDPRGPSMTGRIIRRHERGDTYQLAIAFDDDEGRHQQFSGYVQGVINALDPSPPQEKEGAKP